MRDTYLYTVIHCFLTFQVKITRVYIYTHTFFAQVGEEVSEMRAVPKLGLISECAEGDAAAVAGEGMGGRWDWLRISPGRSCCPQLNDYLAGIIEL